MLFERQGNTDEENFNQKPLIKVVGVGGGGNNAIDRMVENEVRGVEFIAINTDAQALAASKADTRVQIGKTLTRGLGAGANPTKGRNAALESEEDIRAALTGADLIFVTCGMGGGTGTGAAPIVARIAKELGALTIGICTKPFQFEGSERMSNAISGLEAIRPYVDTLIVVPNQRLFSVISPDTTTTECYREIDNILRQGIQSISELINFHGTINVDFADIKTVMQDKGTALMGIGVASGKNRAIEAARKAIHSDLLEVSIDGATSAIVNITASTGITMFEVQSICDEITNNCDKNLNIIWGQAYNDDLKDEIVVTVIATGYELKAKETGVEDIWNKIYESSSKERLETKLREMAIDEEETEEDDDDNETVDDVFKKQNIIDIKKEQKRRLKEEAKSKKLAEKERRRRMKSQSDDDDDSDSSEEYPDWIL